MLAETLYCMLSTVGAKKGEKHMQLSAPRTITFIISIIIAVVAAVLHYAQIETPFTRTGFTILLVGYLVLVGGNVFRNV